MKLCSRPVEVKEALDTTALTDYFSRVVDIEGIGTSDVYRKVLVTGAAAVLRLQGIISDYQVGMSRGGHYGIVVSVRTGHGEYWDLYL